MAFLAEQEMREKWARNFDARARREGLKLDKSGLFAAQHGKRSGLVVVTGDKQIDQRLALLIPKAQRKIVRQATRTAAKNVVLPEAKRRVPKRSKGLSRSLTVRAKKRSRRFIGHTVVTRGSKTDYDDQYYGKFSELGTKHQKAQRWLRGAIYDTQNESRDVFFAAVRGLILTA